MARIKNKGKKNLSDRVKEKVKKSTNPFEVHVNRQKFSVIGRKLKHDKGLPGIARSKAFKKRKATLLHEYQVKNKSNKFTDRRIGEKNKYMSAEDKLTARFTAERMRAHKKSIYNLADDEILTHRGHTLSEIEKFDDPKSDDEEDEKGKLDAKFVAEAHFGGFLKKKEETESQTKSRKDLIDQLISESKRRRYEKQKMQDETLELTDKLDTQWKDLLPLVSFGNSEPPAPAENTTEPKTEAIPKEKVRVDPYDIAVQELKFEARGVPSEKLKTEEEIAREEKEKLEKLESERQRRMHGFLDEQPSSLKHRSADDLDDGLDLDSDIEEDDNPKNKNGEAEESGDDDSVNKGSDKDDEGDDEDSEEDEHNMDEEDSDQSEKDNLSDLLLESSDDDEKEEKSLKNTYSCKKSYNDDAVTSKLPKKVKSVLSEGKNTIEMNEKEQSPKLEEKQNLSPKAQEKLENISSPKNIDEDYSKISEKIRSELLKRKTIMEVARKELPYTFEVPDTYDDFADIMKDLGPEHQSVVLERMIKCTHPSLKSGNKERLENLFALLMQHLNDCAHASESQRSFSGQCPVLQPTFCFAVLGNIVSHLYDLAQHFPENAAYCVSEVLVEKFADLKKEYPGLDTLVFLRLIPQLFPTSDFRHPVSTPALILMTHALRSCKVKSKRDVATGLFISTVMLECTSLSKRFSPEVLNFLLGILYMGIPKAEGLPMPPPPPPPFKSNSDESNLLVIIKDPFKGSEILPDLMLEPDDLDENHKKTETSFKVRALGVASQLTVSWIKQLKDLPSCREIFLPFVILIPFLPLAAYPQSLVDSIKTLEKALNELMNDTGPLEKLTHAAKKPKPLKLYEPAIIDLFDGQKRRTVSRERQEREKLLHKYKKEMKGAIREIRRDKDFLAKVKVKETLRNDMQRIEKVKEIFGAAALQQGEIRKLERKK